MQTKKGITIRRHISLENKGGHFVLSRSTTLGRTSSRSSLMRQTKGQIWVETVVYTLIAFTLIGLVLAFIKPKIEEIQDKGIVEQSVSVLQDMDSIIRSMGSSGNQRVIQLGISKGTLSIDGDNDKIFFDIETNYAYSEPDQEVNNGGIVVYTSSVGSEYNVNLTLNYGTNYNVQFEGADTLSKISRASVPYKIIISNAGTDDEGKIKINFEVVN